MIAKRATLGDISRLPEVDVPRTDNVDTASDLREWVRKFGLPAMLKLDGSWGGNDVVWFSATNRKFAEPFGR